MRALFNTLLICTLISITLYPQIEISDEPISYPKFLEEKFIVENPNRIIDPEELDSIIDSLMDLYHIPGLAALIVKHDSIVWSQNYGYANIQQTRPVEDSTMFIMASISKTIMATVFMQLWENGLVNLEDNINNYLTPDFQVVNPSHQNDTITIQMLLTHTSSINDNYSILNPLVFCGDNPVSLDSFLINYFTPGGIYYSTANFNGFAPSSTVFDYSNVGASLLAYIAQKVTGISFDQYCHQNLLYPLEMERASWFLAGLDTNNVATPYNWAGQYIALCHSGWPIYPIAQLRTNKLELAHFLLTYMNQGTYNGVTILNNSTVDLMLTVHKQVDPYNNWGLMWHNAILNNRSLWGHTGAWYGGSTAMFFYPEEDWGVIIFYNRYPGNEYWEIIGAVCEYAHIFGDIYAINTKVNKPYITPVNDTLIVRTEFSNFNQHDFTANAIYNSSDSSYIDSVALYDDGLHGDSLAGDGVWGGFIHSVSEEEIFSIGISTVDIQAGKYFYSGDLTRFTTAGPIVVDSLTITYNSVTDIYQVKPHLKNEGQTFTVEDLQLSMSSIDSTITSISGPLSISSIPPGGTVTSSGSYTVIVDSNFTKPFNFNFEILCGGWFYWNDSISIVTSVEDEQTLPISYKLYQNYPNPFNPTTTIKYSIPKLSFVTIKVYDVLGREVETLVNKEKPIGNYKIEFNAAALSSGIYFYRLQAGDFIQTKKMVLMK